MKLYRLFAKYVSFSETATSTLQLEGHKKSLRLMNSNLFLRIPLATALLLAVSCAAKEQIANEPTRSGFIQYRNDSSAEFRSEQFPLLYSWTNPKVMNMETGYDTLEILPINLNYLDLRQWEKSKNALIRDEKDYLHYTQLVAAYFMERLEKKLREDLKAFGTSRCSLVFPSSTGTGMQDLTRARSSESGSAGGKDKGDIEKLSVSPGESWTMQLEIAFTDVVFGSPAQHAGALLLPVPGMSAAWSTVTSPRLAFEARARKKGEEEDLFVAADRKFPRVKLLDLNKLTVTSPLREVSDLWVEELSRMLFRERDEEEVSGTFGFTFLPW